MEILKTNDGELPGKMLLVRVIEDDKTSPAPDLTFLDLDLEKFRLWHETLSLICYRRTNGPINIVKKSCL